MYTLFVIVHILVAAVLILVVLLQSGKAGDLASAFGGAGSQTAFGSRSAATFLTKATSVCAVTFMITSLGLAIMSAQKAGTVMETVPTETGAPVEQPSQPAGTGQENQPVSQPPADQPTPEKPSDQQ